VVGPGRPKVRFRNPTDRVNIQDPDRVQNLTPIR
jgi:hypothetical protein